MGSGVGRANQMPDCSEVKIPPSASVASLQETPGLFEILGCDVFEFEAGPHKYKFLLMRDRAASGLIQTELRQQFAGEGQPSAWEPTSEDIIRIGPLDDVQPLSKVAGGGLRHLFHISEAYGFLLGVWSWTFGHSSRVS